MPPLPVGVNIMDTVCTDTIPLPPAPDLAAIALPDDDGSPHKQSSPPPHKQSPQLAHQHSTISFGFKGKHSSALPGQSIFNEEDAARRKINFPKRRKLAHKKHTGLSFIPTSEDVGGAEGKDGADLTAAEQAAAEEELLYPIAPDPAAAASPTVEEARSKPHFKKMTFIQSTENLGGTKPAAGAGEEGESPAAAEVKPDLTQFVKVRVTVNEPYGGVGRKRTNE